MKLSQKIFSPTHRIMIYGPPKSGKSQLAGTAALKYNVLWFDLENGSDVLLKLPAEAQNRVELISIPDTKFYPIGIETMLKVIKGGKVTICEAHGKVACPICTRDNAPSVTVCLNELSKDTVVVVDSLTQLTASALAHITKEQPDDYKPTWEDWGNLGKLMHIFLSAVQQAKYNIICISHETEVEMVDGKEKIVPTAGTRNFSRNSARYFDHVIYCEVKNKKHVATSTTTAINNILTGSRTDFQIENGQSLSIVPLLESVLQKEQTPEQKAITQIAAIAKEASIPQPKTGGILLRKKV